MIETIVSLPKFTNLIKKGRDYLMCDKKEIIESKLLSIYKIYLENKNHNKI